MTGSMTLGGGAGSGAAAGGGAGSAAAGGASLNIRESAARGVYVEGLTETVVSSVAQAQALLAQGMRARRVAATAMNHESSRSHSVFTLCVETAERAGRGGEAIRSRTAMFHLIDLAGSERQKATGATGERLKEASQINKSLSSLAGVIGALVDIAGGRSRHVHYRDSKLTYLLRDSLGGNAKTSIIATVSPADDCYPETLATLKFAETAKLVRVARGAACVLQRCWFGPLQCSGAVWAIWGLAHRQSVGHAAAPTQPTIARLVPAARVMSVVPVAPHAGHGLFDLASPAARSHHLLRARSLHPSVPPPAASLPARPAGQEQGGREREHDGQRVAAAGGDPQPAGRAAGVQVAVGCAGAAGPRHAACGHHFGGSCRRRGRHAVCSARQRRRGRL